MKDSQYNLLVGLILIAGVVVVIFFIVELADSKPGEISTALSTIIGGSFVLGGAALAWWSVQRREKEDERRRRLNLFLKAQHMTYILTQVAPLQLMAAQLSFSTLTPDGNDIPGHVPAAELRIPRPRQLDELWENLSEFPADAIYEIRNMTQFFDRADEYLKNAHEVPDSMRSSLVGYYSSILDAANVLGAIMADTELIKSYCVANSDRNRILYGDPE
jgi:hypothetical protein